MIGAVIAYAYVFCLLMIAPIFEKYGKEVSRKFVHIMTANWWFIIMIFFEKSFWPIIISLSFIGVNLISYKYNVFKCIEREEAAQEKGTIYYAITMLLLVIISYYYEDLYIGLIGVLIMGYADGLAAIIGKRMNFCPYLINENKKSISGNVVMFSISFLVVYSVMEHLHYTQIVCTALMIASIVTIIEAVSVKGTDNLTVPLSAVGLYIWMIK
ncbi:MAG: diacylglycerol/polyprenol kinase family protein [Cellulosilyticaceae bacterium]